MKHELVTMDHTGDTKLLWDSDNKDEVDNAREAFNRLTKKGYLAYAVKGKNGDKGEQVKSFDPEAERIILTPALVGG